MDCGELNIFYIPSQSFHKLFELCSSCGREHKNVSRRHFNCILTRTDDHVIELSLYGWNRIFSNIFKGPVSKNLPPRTNEEPHIMEVTAEYC